MYTVYCGQRYIGKYLARNEQEAIMKATSSQTGNAKHLYRAER
jgi:hypothetical protein